MPVLSKLIEWFNRSNVVSHIAFWIFIELLLAYHGSLFGGNFKDNLVNMLALLPVQMIAAYLLVYVQIPKLLYKKHTIQFILSFLIIAYLMAILARISIIYLAEPIIGTDSLNESIIEILSSPVFLIRVFVTSVYIPAIILFLIKMTKERFTQQNQLVVMEREKKTAELDFLKAQMNPHFLFNTLNNLYSLSKKKSEHTSEMILKLSDILDYTLYECRQDKVPVMKEWELIENYIELETLRYHDPLDIVLDQQIDDPRITIAPLILISLVENAFKFSLKTKIRIPRIDVRLKVENKELVLEVINSRVEDLQDSKKNKGIGFQNLKRQLALLYPANHTICVKDQPDYYSVSLTIQL